MEEVRTAPRPATHWLRSVGAVLAGFFATFILTMLADGALHLMGILPGLGEPMPDRSFLLPAAYRILFTFVGGYVAAKAAPARPMAHAWGLAWLGFAAGLLSLFAYLDGLTPPAPLWYALSIPVSALPAVLTGGWLASRGTARAAV